MTTEPVETFVPEIARESWALFQKEALVFVLGTAVVLLLSAVSLGVLLGPLAVGFLDLVAKALRGEPVQVGDVFNRFDAFASSLIALLIVGVAVCVGTLLFVVPGLIAGLFSGFTLHAIAYEGLQAVPAIKRSAQMVRDNLVNSLVLFLLIAVAQSLGGSVVFGVLLTTPLSLIASAIAYRRLAATSESTPLVA